MKKQFLLLIFSIAFLSFTFHSEKSLAHVTVTIKPLHSLTLNLVKNTDIKTVLLIKGNVSPHVFYLKPSHQRFLNKSDLIVYIDDEFETFLKKPLAGLRHKVDQLSLGSYLRKSLVPQRQEFGCPHCAAEARVKHHNDYYAYAQEHGDHKHEHREHGHHNHEKHESHQLLDYHFWMDPDLAAEASRVIARRLIKTYPKWENEIKANLQELESRLKILGAEIKSKFMKLENAKFIAFHDAYQYLENAYFLTLVDVVLINHDHSPSVKHVHRLRKKIKQNNIKCIFSEPQFEHRWLYPIADNLEVKLVEIDPLGSLLPASEDQYFVMMHQLTTNMRKCLLTNSAP